MGNISLRLSIKLAYVVFLLIPLYVVIKNSGVLTPSLATYFFLRLTGLYAFFLIFLQIMLGGFMPIWQKIFGPKATVTHEKFGLITYSLILAHPAFFLAGAVMRKGLEGLYSTLVPQFITKTDTLLNYGRLGFTLITLAVFASYFRHKSFLNRHWLKFHILNYLAFWLLFLHSWNIGSDTQTFPLNYIYPAMAVLVSASVAYRFAPRLASLARRGLANLNSKNA